MSEAATFPVTNPESEVIASKKHETTIIADRVHFVNSTVVNSRVYTHGQLTGNTEAKEHLIKVVREGQVEGNTSRRELTIDDKVQSRYHDGSVIIEEHGHLDGTLAHRALAIKKGGVSSGRTEILATMENKNHILGLVAGTSSRVDTEPARSQNAWNSDKKKLAPGWLR